MEAPSAGRRNNAAGTVASPSEGAGGALKGPREQRFLVSAAGKWVSSPGRLWCVSNKKSILAGPLGGGWGKRGGSAKVDGAGAGVHGLAPPPTLPGSPGDSAHCPPARAPAHPWTGTRVRMLTGPSRGWALLQNLAEAALFTLECCFP